jgi:hypothetical protein
MEVRELAAGGKSASFQFDIVLAVRTYRVRCFSQQEYDYWLAGLRAGQQRCASGGNATAIAASVSSDGSADASPTTTPSPSPSPLPSPSPSPSTAVERGPKGTHSTNTLLACRLQPVIATTVSNQLTTHSLARSIICTALGLTVDCSLVLSIVYCAVVACSANPKFSDEQIFELLKSQIEALASYVLLVEGVVCLLVLLACEARLGTK